MTEKQYRRTLLRGTQILEKIMPELNKVSDEFIRKRSNKVFRREEDVNEIAIALGLYDEFIEGLLV